jgi:succinoglycan biosynthesis transport protein ExoP
MDKDAAIEFDLNKYVRAFLPYWRWIVAAGVIVALAALAVSFLSPPTYEAVALVAITKAPYTLNFDPRFATVPNTTQAFKAYPELAKSDDVLQSVYAKLDPRPKPIETLRDLNSALRAESGTDPSLVRLRVQAQSAADAARIANLWVDTFITGANAVYGTDDQQQVQSFEAQAAGAEKELQADEQAIINYQAHDRSAILQNQLTSTQQEQIDYLANQRNVTYLLQDIAGLREQLSKQPATNPSALADRLTALFLQIKAYKAQATVPIQLQFSNPDAVASASVGQQIAFLDSLSSSMQAQLTDMDARLKQLEPQVLTLQQQLQQSAAEKDRLTRTRDVARQTYMTLAQKVAETRIAAQNGNGAVQLASRAAPPQEPIGPRKALNTVLGGIAGLILGIIAVFSVAWLRESRTTQHKIQEAGAVGR